MLQPTSGFQLSSVHSMPVLDIGGLSDAAATAPLAGRVVEYDTAEVAQGVPCRAGDGGGFAGCEQHAVLVEQTVSAPLAKPFERFFLSRRHQACSLPAASRRPISRSRYQRALRRSS